MCRKSCVSWANYCSLAVHFSAPRRRGVQGNRMTIKHRFFRQGILAALLLGVGAPVLAADNDPAAADEALVQRIKEAVIKELRESGALDQQIDQGIQRFIVRQQAARQAEEQRQAHKADELAKNVRPVSKERDHILGNPDAEVSIIEYSDFECPYCKRFHETAHELIKAFDGRVNWVYRHFPLAFHNPAAQHEAEASECAAELGGNEAFWKFADQVYAHTPSNGKGVTDAQMAAFAENAGVDKTKFAACVKSGRHAALVKQDLEEGASVGITGTPGNILRNNKSGAVLSRAGARPFEMFKADLDNLLNNTN